MLSRIFVIIAIVLVMANPGVTTSAQSEPLTKIRVVEIVRAHLFDPMYVTIGKGFVKEQGLDIELTTVTTTNGIGAQILGGQADIALSGTQIPIYLYGGESPDKPVIFCALAGTDGLYVVSRKRIDNFDWSMMNGKVILGYPPGSAPTSSLSYLMKQHGVDLKSIKLIDNISPAARDGAWISGTADFGVFIEPSTTKLVNSGQAFVVASMGKELGRADYSLFYATRSWIDKNPSTAQKWTNAIAKALTWMKSASAAEVADVVAPFFPGMSKQENAEVVERFRSTGAPIWSDTTEVDVAGLAKFQEVMVVGGTLSADKVVPYDKIVTTRFSSKAIP